MKQRETSSYEYFEYLLKRPSLFRNIRKAFFLTLAREFRGKVLDIGCGGGGFLEVYKNSVGIDTNKYIVNYLQGRGFEVYCASVYSLPFPREFFDGVLLSHVLEHLRYP